MRLQRALSAIVCPHSAQVCIPQGLKIKAARRGKLSPLPCLRSLWGGVFLCGFCVTAASPPGRETQLQMAYLGFIEIVDSECAISIPQVLVCQNKLLEYFV